MMEIQDLLRGVRSFCDGTSGAFHGRLNLRRKFVQDSENPKFGKKDWKIPRAGRIIRRSVYAFLRAATLGKDQPFMPMTFYQCLNLLLDAEELIYACTWGL